MSLLVLNLLALFLIGFLQDALSAYYLRLVQEERPGIATVISFVHSILGWGVWCWFMYQFQHPDALSGVQAVINSAGGAFGTYLGLRRPGEKKGIS